MAKLIEGIPGRKLDPDFDIDENNAWILSDDDMDDVDLHYDVKSYIVDDSQSPAHVKIFLKDGNSVIVSMKKTELKAYTKAINEILEEDDPDRPLTIQETKEVVKQIQANYTPGQKIAWKICKVAFGILGAALVIAILNAIFGG